MSTSAPSTSAAPASTPAPAAATWVPKLEGDYDVGATSIVLDDPERPLTVEVWFPLAADTDVAALTPQRYSLLPTVYVDSGVAYAADAEMMAPDAAFPLVVFSHGSGGLRYINARYTEALASHGYVVVSADHPGDTAADALGGTPPPESRFADRSRDLERLIDAFTGATETAAAPFTDRVDSDQIALIGHSLGGWTALAAAVGSDQPPATVEPDDRIGAVVPIAPAVTGLLSADRLARLTQPMLVLVGTDDVTTPPSPHVDDLWEATTDRPAYRVELVGAEHESFTEICRLQVEIPKLPDVPEAVTEAIDNYALEGCQPDDMPADRANEIAVTYTVDFLAEVFSGGDPIGDNPPDDVEFERR